MEKLARGATPRPVTALTIAASDSGGGAGIHADLLTFAAHGVYGATVLTAGTAQNTRAVTAVEPFSVRFVTKQIDAVFDDLRPRATKIGMLATSAIVEAVAAAIGELDLPFVVLDPVIVSTSGEPLLDADGVQMLIAELLPHAFVVTPNIHEAETLSGCTIRSADDVKQAAVRLREMGAGAVIITGGHGWDESTGLAAAGLQVVDVLFDGHVFREFLAPRIDSRHTHGTGCTYAAAIAAGLALGHELPEAAARAQQYVAGAIAHAPGLGHGRGPLKLAPSVTPQVRATVRQRGGELS